jgi:hypothetical protein
MTCAACEICWLLQPKRRHLPMRVRSSAIQRDGGGGRLLETLLLLSEVVVGVAAGLGRVEETDENGRCR